MSRLKLLLFTFLFSCSFVLQAQIYNSVQLPTPDNLTPLFVGSIANSKIYYGAEPANADPNKPVIVFVHGFIDLANSWFLPGNEIYDEAYADGYRSAFVAMTRGEGMWTNGHILGGMLEDITDHYGVDNVVIVAHSNGGKASEVAMFYQGKRALVDRVISLGTPFKGTELANLSQTFWFSWLVDFIGLGDGAATSTTYYMQGVARPYLDNLPNNQPQKFFNFGGWGWNVGTTLAAPVMYTGGLILNANGSGSNNGGNDGVTPYWSSTRPGGLEVWGPGYGNPDSRYDHLDIASDYVWDDIEPYFTGPLGTLRAVPTNEQPQAKRANVQYLYSEGNQNTFMVEENVGRVNISILHQNADDVFTIINNNREVITIDTELTEGYFNNFATSLQTSLEAGTYQILSDEEFGAIVNYENGIELVHYPAKHTYNQGDELTIEIAIENTTANYDDAEITAILNRSNLENNQITGQELDMQLVKLRPIGGNRFSYTFDNELAEGVYNVMIQSIHGDFSKSMVTGFVVQRKPGLSLETTANISLNTFPNPVKDILTVNVSLEDNHKNTLHLYDAFGRQVYTQNISDLNTTISIDIQNLNIPAGSYYLQIQSGNQQKVQPIIKH